MRYMSTLVIVLFSLIGCNHATAGESKTKSRATMAGTWKTNEPPMVARVAKNTIRIDWKHEDGSRALYWKGTFPKTMRNGAKVVSIGDTETMSTALLASSSTKKSFVYSRGQLVFKLSFMGVTVPVRLSRR